MKVPIEIAVAYSLMRKQAEENAKFDLVAWIRNKIKTKGTMDLIQEMKEVKLRYLAEVMGDYAEHLRKTSGNDYVANQINDWAKEIIDTIEVTYRRPFTEESLNVMKLSKRHKFDDPYHIEGMDIKGFQKCMEDEVVKELLWFIKDKGLVRVRTEKEYDRVPVVTASLYVGVEPGKEKNLENYK